MAKLSADFDYSDAELLALCRQAVAKLTFAEVYEEGGFRVERSDLPKIRETIAWLEQRIAAASGSGTANLGRYARA